MEELRSHKEFLIARGIEELLAIKDSDIRMLTLEQGRDAVDKGIHIGGAFSAIVPLVCLYYGGIMRFDAGQPTRPGQDLFVLSKGHAVAAMASVYADLGFFSRDVLVNSRSADSILNGHPGPVLPGVHISTGPLGQGVGVAQGFAIAGKRSPKFDVYCLAGDGELQEGTVWESVMYSAQKRLDNLCLIVDRNEGQLDCTDRLHFSMRDLPRQLEAFGWRVLNVDGTQYGPVIGALERFTRERREGRPTAILCSGTKGEGGFSSFMQGHKVELPDVLTRQELALQEERRSGRVEELIRTLEVLEDAYGTEPVRLLTSAAERMGLTIGRKERAVRAEMRNVKCRPAPPRDKRIRFEEPLLPVLDPAKEYGASTVITQAMRIYARDPRVVSVDADLSSTSGLASGVGYVDRERGLNVGIAEANMMNIGEAFAALGSNVWVSTFCPFFDWRVMRRIAVGQQERLEVIAEKDGWLTEGHGLDLVFLATAPNLETKTNGATHMGNDDSILFSAIAGLKIIDVSCPNQLLGLMRWVMEGGRGLLYIRIMRSPSPVLYGGDFRFEYGRGYRLRNVGRARAVLISSGRGTHEALAAARILQEESIETEVVDMPSVDGTMLLDLYDSGLPLLFAEQNNGYLWGEFRKLLVSRRPEIRADRLRAVNTATEDERPQFIHSGTYEELVDRLGLSAERLSLQVRDLLKQ